MPLSPLSGSRGLLRDLNSRFGFPEDLSNLCSDFLGGLKRYFKVHQTVGDPCLSSTGVPKGCAVAVYQMLMFNLLVTCSIRDSQECATTTLFSHVDNWLAVGSISDSVPATADSVIASSHKWSFRLNPGKAWASGTLKADGAALMAYSFEGQSVRVPISCTELGINLHFDK